MQKGQPQLPLQLNAGDQSTCTAGRTTISCTPTFAGWPIANAIASAMHKRRHRNRQQPALSPPPSLGDECCCGARLRSRRAESPSSRMFFRRNLLPQRIRDRAHGPLRPTVNRRAWKRANTRNRRHVDKVPRCPASRIPEARPQFHTAHPSRSHRSSLPHSSTRSALIGDSGMMPALFTNTSTLPKVFTPASISATRSPRFVTSQATATAFSAARLDLRDQRIQSLLAPCSKNDGGALPCQFLRGRRADAAAGARNHYNFASNVSHGLFSSRAILEAQAIGPLAQFFRFLA